MRKRNWALLAVLLGMMVVVSGCFGGGRVRETGTVDGYVCVSPADAELPKPIPETYISRSLEIHDKPCGTPLKGATVKVGGIARTTNEDGYFRLYGVPVGSHRLTVAHPEFKDYTSQSFVVRANENTSVTSILEEIYGVGYYLLIGVQNYSDPLKERYPQLVDENNRLSGTHHDVDLVSTHLAMNNSLKTNRIIKMLDPDVSQITAMIEELVGNLWERDYLVIYFSGHVTGDTNFDALVCYDGFLTDGALRESLKGTGSKDITLILDGCFTGSFFDGYTTPAVKAFQGTPYAVLAAATANSKAYEIYDEEYGRNIGLFTKHFVNGLRTRQADRPNTDGSITVSEMYAYVKNKVEGESSQRSRFPEGTQYVDKYLGDGKDPIIFKYRR